MPQPGSSSLSAVTVPLLNEGLPPVRPLHPILSHLLPDISIRSRNVYRPPSFRSASIPFTYGGPGKYFIRPVICGSSSMAWPVQF